MAGVLHVNSYSTASYNLSASYNAAIIYQNAGFGGGLYVTQYAQISNYGRIGGGGVVLSGGGIVTNGSFFYEDAHIGGHAGVIIQGASGTVINWATIASGGAGALLASGGQVTNGAAGDLTALIRGSTGVEIAGAPGDVTNYAVITGAQGVGVFIGAGGNLANGSPTDRTAAIRGSTYGVLIEAAATVTNFGAIYGEGVGAAQYGVVINGGGAVVNGSATDLSASIRGGGGVDLGASGTVQNYGTILGAVAAGVVLLAGGIVRNGGGVDRTALIEGADGVVVVGGAGIVTNSGTIGGLGGGGDSGVELATGGSLLNGSPNNSTATIFGYAGGARLYGASKGTNFGLISGLGDYTGAGVEMGAGSSFTNGAAGHGGAMVQGYDGVIATGATLTNFGTIKGASGTAVEFKGDANTLIVEAGSTFIGQVAGGGGRLILGTGTGTLTGLLTAAGDVTVSKSMATTTFDDFTSLVIAAGASFADAGPGAVATNQLVIDVGALTVAGAVTNAGRLDAANGGVLTAQGAVANTGTLIASAGTLVVDGAVSGAGVVDILSKGLADFAGAFGENVTFTTSGELELAQSQTYSGVINGFSLTGATSLDLRDIAFAKSTTASYSGTASSGTLTVTDGTHTAHIKLTGDYLTSKFTVATDGHGGTLVVDPAATRPPPPAPPVPQFASAAAAFGAGAAGALVAGYHRLDPPPAIAAPRAQFA